MARKKERVKHTPEVHSLPCKLTTEEIAKSAEDLASAIQEMESIEIEKKATMKEYNSMIDNCKKRIHRLMTHVKNGVEYRSVPCDLQFHINKVLAILVRDDTGEIVDERPMTEEEKQMQIEFSDDANNKRSMQQAVEDTEDDIC